MYHFNFPCKFDRRWASERTGEWPDRSIAMKAILILILAVAALLCCMEVSAMADSTVSFEADAVGAVPKGWTATKTGRGDPKWTIEQEPTAPSRSKVVKQSGRADYPLLLKDD